MFGSRKRTSAPKIEAPIYRFTISGDDPSEVGRDYLRFRDSTKTEDDVAADAEMWSTRDVLIVCITIIAAAIGFGLAIWGVSE